MRISVLLFLLYCANVSDQRSIPSIVEVLQELYPPAPPHCSRAVVTVSQQSNLNNVSPSPTTTKLKLNLGVGQTVCFKYSDSDAFVSEDGTNVPQSVSTLQSNNTLHTLTLFRLEQYYPIRARYRFAIPEVHTRCICECDQKSESCRASAYRYGRCTATEDTATGSSQACHRTFFSMQPATGCPNGESASPQLCCELRFRPYQGRTFTALRLEAPTTLAVLRYSAFGWTPKGRWEEADKRVIRVQLDGSTQKHYLDSLKNVELSIAAPGRTTNQLEPGMYFVENFGPGHYGELVKQPLNDIVEHSFEKLGWFRLSADGSSFIQGGEILMEKIHRAKVENCVEQKYSSILDANYYINGDANDTTRFNMADTLNQTMRWIRSARVVDEAERHAIVTENDGTNMEISLTPPSRRDLAFVHNDSRIDDFHATIIVDRFSNTVLNITAFNASGVLNGYVKPIGDVLGETIDTFSVTASQFGDGVHERGTQQLIARIKPYAVNTVHMVCIRPDEGPRDAEICRPVESVYDELETNTVTNVWSNAKGNCPECNKLSMDGFMKYLNPANWTKGVSSISEAFMMASDIFGYLFVFLVFYVVLAKFVVPLLQCCFCPFLYSRSK